VSAYDSSLPFAGVWTSNTLRGHGEKAEVFEYFGT